MNDCIVKTLAIDIEGRRMKALLLRPKKPRPAAQTPGLLWLHGGGYVTGMAEMVFFSRALPLVRKYGAVVLAPAYRLAGEAPYPAALTDCYGALCYLKEHAAELGCDPSRLMVGGESAGGGLTAALCMFARDRGEVSVACQFPLYPMLDDRDTPSSRNNHGVSWGTRRNHWAWRQYLRGLRGETPPAYAVPARREDYAGLPPTYTFVGEREPFFDETLRYVEALRNAGVEAAVDVYPTGFHAFDMLLPFRPLSRKAAAVFERRFREMAEHGRAPQYAQDARKRSEE